MKYQINPLRRSFGLSLQCQKPNSVNLSVAQFFRVANYFVCSKPFLIFHLYTSETFSFFRLKLGHSCMIFKVNDGVKLLPSIRQNFFYDFVPFSKFKVSVIDLYDVVRIKFKVRFESTKINFALMLWLVACNSSIVHNILI